MLIHQLLENSTREFPDKPALWYKESWISYRELDQRATALANSLLAAGLQRLDRVALLWENSFEYVIAYYAILKAGAVTVALNTEIVPADLQYLLEDSGARFVILQHKYASQIERMAQGPGDLTTLITDNPSKFGESAERQVLDIQEMINNGGDDYPEIANINIDLASIIYTSGSTGKPKGVMLSHLNVMTNTRSIVSYLQLDANDRIMVILPFFYVYGKSLLNTHVAVGGSLVLDNRFTFPNAVLKTMSKMACTGFAGVPSTFSILLNKSSAKKMRFPALRYLTQAGGPMAPAMQKEVVLAFYPARLFVMYGATEASARLSWLDPAELTHRWGSIGKGIPNVELFVADQDGKPVPRGEAGEIVARGANLMMGYWNDPEETARVLRNGLYFTGDLGKMDDEGYIYVVGRAKDMIKAGANRISAKEIEEKMLEHGSIYEAAVIGVDDPMLGEAIKAYVVSKSDNGELTPDIVIGHCKQVLPPFKVPKFVEMIDALPKNSSGKIDKLALKKLHEEFADD